MPRGGPARRARGRGSSSSGRGRAGSTTEPPPPRKRVRACSSEGGEGAASEMPPLPRRAAAMSAAESIRRRAMSGRRSKTAAPPAAPKKDERAEKEVEEKRPTARRGAAKREGRVVLEAPGDGMVLGRACAEALVGACRDSVGEGRVGVAFDVETTAGHVAVKLWRVQRRLQKGDLEYLRAEALALQFGNRPRVCLCLLAHGVLLCA